MIITISSERLVLRKIEEPDWEILYKTVVAKTFPDDLPLKTLIKTQSDAKNWIHGCIQSWNEGKRYTWSICLKSQPEVIVGQVSLTQRPDMESWALAFWISPHHQKKGYARESVYLIIDQFEIEGFKTVFWAGAAIWNEGSNKVLIDCGFKKTGKNEKGYTCNDKPVAIYEYELNKTPEIQPGN